LLAAFAECFFHTERIDDRNITGRNIIIREVLLKYIHRIIDIDKAAAPFTLLGLEKRIEVVVPVTAGSKSVGLNMGGFIDRLEYCDNTLRIIDYKTGAAKRNFAGIESLFDRDQPDNHAALQTLVYAYLTRLFYPEHTAISSGLYVVRDFFKNQDYDARIYISKQETIENYFTVAKAFENELNVLLSEIFLSDEAFTQTEDEKKCGYCPYADICHRN
jgi:ATP-dependent exoDNAse (exonuclease V) beta subunit